MSCSSVASSVTENEGTEECIGSGYGEGTWTGTGGAGLGGGAYECTESPRRTSSSSAKRTARFPLQIVKWKKIRTGASKLENRRRKGELMQGSGGAGGGLLGAFIFFVVGVFHGFRFVRVGYEANAFSIVTRVCTNSTGESRRKGLGGA